MSPFIQVHITAATERLTRDCKSVRNGKNGAAQSKCGHRTPSTMIWSGSKWVQCRLSCASGSTRVASQPHIIASVAPTHLPTVPRVRMHTAIMTCRHDVSFSPSPFTMKAIVPAWVRRGGGGIRRHSRSTWSSLQRDTRPEIESPLQVRRRNASAAKGPLALGGHLTACVARQLRMSITGV